VNGIIIEKAMIARWGESGRARPDALPIHQRKEPPMRLIDGLTTIRTRLADNDADFTTLRFVDIYIKRAQGADVSVPSLMTALGKLMRTPEANGDSGIYNDLVLLEEQLQGAAAIAQAQRAEEEARPTPKLKKDYKVQREKERAAKKS